MKQDKNHPQTSDQNPAHGTVPTEAVISRSTAPADAELSRNTVPADQRKSWVSLSLVWAGIIFTVISLTTGGGLVTGLTFKETLIASLAGTCVLGVIAILLSLQACRTGLTFALSTRYIFGESGAKVVSLLAPIANIGWFIIIAATFGHFVSLVIGCGPVGEAVCMIVSTLAVGVVALYGFKALTVISYISIPVIIVLCVYVAVYGVGQIGGFSQVLSYVPETRSSLSLAITAVIGTWISGVATGISNFTRFAKNARSAVLTCVFGMVIAYLFMLICGALTCISLKNGDVPQVLVSMGLIVPGIILMAANSFASNAGTLYNVTLNLANVLPFKREKMLVVIVLGGAVLTLFKPYEIGFVFRILNLLGIIFTPLAGIMVADFFVLNRMRYPKLEDTLFRKWNPYSWLSLALGIAGAALIPWGNQALNGLFISGIVYIVIMKLTRYQVIRKS